MKFLVLHYSVVSLSAAVNDDLKLKFTVVGEEDSRDVVCMKPSHGGYCRCCKEKRNFQKRKMKQNLNFTISLLKGMMVCRNKKVIEMFRTELRYDLCSYKFMCQSQIYWINLNLSQGNKTETKRGRKHELLETSNKIRISLNCKHWNQ